MATSMDTRTAGDKRLVPNAVLTGLRESRGWGRGRLAREFELVGRRHQLGTPERSAMEKQIYRLETGRTVRPTELYAELYRLTFDKSAVELFGDLVPAPRSAATSSVRSHKFIPLFVGAELAARFAADGSLDVEESWTPCRRRPIEHDEGRCQAYVWPFGVVVLHLVEQLDLESVAQLAVWRRMTYDRDMAWAREQVEALAGAAVNGEPYVLSLYWIDEPAWHGRELDVAARLLCIPRVLVSRTERIDKSALAPAALVERSLLQDGFDHPELVDFGMKGVSLGLASWSGVVYHPIARDRALHEDELVGCELSVQAAWAYCDHLRRQVEAGVDPDVPAEFGWRFLRGMRSRLTNERPQETSQHRAMREAVVETSGLARHLAQAVDILRECDGT